MKHQIDSDGAIALDRSRFLDYVALTKPELTFLSVLTALAGFLLAAGNAIEATVLLHTLLGTALIGGGAGALNQYAERRFDAVMKRTEQRPLPSGRLAPHEALVFGISSAVVGLLDLILFVNLATALLGLATLAMYVFVYTPMKRITPAATLVGAVPGALPPVMGWAALRHDITPQIGLLFAILFIWQMPHFLSLAWLYRRDYARAGYKLLTTGDVDGTRTGRHILGYTLGLLPLAILPGVVDGVHPAYITAAALLGISFSCLAVLFARSRSQASARNLFLASLLYLPALLVFLVACAD